MRIYIYIIFLGSFLFSCSNDKGNYDYSSLNKVTVEDIETSYSFVLGKLMDIDPTVTQSGKPSELDYLWEIDGFEVSTEKHLYMNVPEHLTAGKKTARFTVFDKSTGLYEYITFSITLTAPFNRGYYFLTENEVEDAILSFYPSSNVEEGEYKGEVFEHTRSIDGYLIGKKPLNISGYFESISALNDYGWIMYVLTSESEYPCIVTNCLNFTAMSLVNEDSYMDQEKGYDFAPTEQGFTMRSETFFITSGKIANYSSNSIYRPSEHGKEYFWSNLITDGRGVNSLTAFDKLTSKFYTIVPGDDPYAFDNVLEINNSPSLVGKLIVGTHAVRGTIDKYVLAIDEVGLNFLHFQTASTEGDFIGNDVVPTTLFDENSQAALIADNDWFISSNNVIYTAPVLQPSLSVYATIPEDCGVITAIGPSTRNATIIVAAYNEHSSSEYKGSVIFIDKQSGKMTVFKNVIHKCVSLLGANSNSFWAGDGDDK